MTTIGFIGSGHIGSQLARLFVANGDSVVMSNSRGPQTLTDLITELGPNATAGSVQDAADAGDIVVVTVPMGAIASVPADSLAGKVVIDTNNYYFERDGHIDAIDDKSTTVSEILQAHAPAARIVKVFNSIRFDHLTTEGTPSGTPGRRALPIAGDYADAKATVTALLDTFGFDAVDVGNLGEGWRFDRNAPAYGAELDAAALRDTLAAAER
jgi:predicted dinucleotide-binding enzyme